MPLGFGGSGCPQEHVRLHSAPWAAPTWAQLPGIIWALQSRVVLGWKLPWRGGSSGKAGRARMAESLGNTGPSGSVLCPAMEVVLVLVDPAHNKAFIPAAAWPHPAGNETVPAIRVLPHQFGSRRGCSRAALAWSLCPCAPRGPHPCHQPRDVPLVPPLSTAVCMQSCCPGPRAVWVVLIIGIKFP